MMASGYDPHHSLSPRPASTPLDPSVTSSPHAVSHLPPDLDLRRYDDYPPPPPQPQYDQWRRDQYGNYGAPQAPHPQSYGPPPPGPQYGAPDPYYRDARDPYYPPPPRDPYADSYNRPHYPPAPQYDPYPPPPRDPFYQSYPEQLSQQQYDAHNASLPLIITCRPLTLNTFLVEKPLYSYLELRWVPHLEDLQADVRRASLQNPSITGKRRRVFISAVGGPDELIRDVRWSTPEMEWRETLSVVELKRELERQDERWRNVVVGAEDRVREREEREERERIERIEREREERERGARELDLGVLEAVEREGREMDGREAKEARAREWARVKDQEREDEKARVARRSAGGVELVAVVDPVSVETNGTHEVVPVSKKRKGSEELEAQHKRVPERKFLDSICKLPRRNCAEWATTRGVTVDLQTAEADAEPVLGERQSGIWQLFGEPVSEIAPQVQVLMARYIRDSTRPPRLRMYESLEANKQLTETVPWFAKLIQEAKDRYDEVLVGSTPPSPPPHET